MASSVIIVALFFVVIINSIHYSVVEGNSSLTDRRSVNCMKGVAALLIVFSHAHYYLQNLSVLKIFKPFGYIGVSLFFFCSGYGVMKKYILDEHYLDDFLAKRLNGVYIPYIITTILWFLTNSIFLWKDFDKDTMFNLIINSIFLIGTSLPFAWYVLVVLIWYLVFFLVAKIFKDSKKILFCLLVLDVIWYFIGICTGIASFYYNGTCCLIVGCVIAVIEDKIRVPDSLTLLSSVVTLGVSILALHIWGGNSPLLYTVVVASGSAIFVMCLYIVGYKFEFYSDITKSLGQYSYEIYLTQGIAYVLAKEVSRSFGWIFWIVFTLSMLVFIHIERIIKGRIGRLDGRKMTC